ncbi:PBS lyase HEAT-like repeat domain protein [hydrothermal vent metagenome]|uniref:PBS lyase HEAT-like repeat domain protein n=1 Tax=hydrothermal vent metagenome TaxID=652676 RepID=A0A3B0TJT8_9ZZZZ
MKNPEDLEVRQLLKTLGSKNGLEREKARGELVAKGKNMVDYLTGLLNHPKHIYRWEALKTMKEIGDPASIPLFIRSLEDDESDIRWIAAEGLIKMGVQSVKPLLKILIEKSGSIFILAGAHHVFYSLKKAEKVPAGFPVDKLLSTLKNPEWNGSVKPLAFRLLSSL